MNEGSPAWPPLLCPKSSLFFAWFKLSYPGAFAPQKHSCLIHTQIGGIDFISGYPLAWVMFFGITSQAIAQINPASSRAMAVLIFCGSKPR